MRFHVYSKDPYTIGSYIEVRVGSTTILAKIVNTEDGKVTLETSDRDGGYIKEVLYSPTPTSFSIGTKSQ